ncbi:perforin like protein 5, putative [Plasmodium gallinaceum]|uniref:Perforin like protein 5, putative n=1 Tax=Plasmodium gallinaceum TaxID=5849 RepID=A0A1J1GLV7_PLAGA|nr:perforin like protein 5, putative [Plasmodium gallinaceum]CRG93416.1 perforin like protein 5, putative [Plasmodium gallinaceum]
MGLKYSALFVFALLIHLTVYNLSNINIFNTSFYSEDAENFEKKYFFSYLGMTYDIIKGNPLGDPLFVTDLGYKRYILKDKIELDDMLIDDEKKKSKLYYTVSKRKKIKCLHSKKPNIINELSDINNEYKSYKFPSQFEIYPFNASNYYKLLVEKINNGNSIIIDKKICSKYFASLHEVISDDLDSFFLSTLNELGNNYQDIKGDIYKCNVQFYKYNKYNKNCLKTITPWITFFNLYGTHLVSEAYFGGIIINNLYVENENIKYSSHKIKLYKRRLNPFYNSNSNLYFGSIISKEKIIYIKERDLMLNGGNKIIFEKSIKQNSYKKWEDSIKGNLAKPVKLIFIPFAEFIISKDGKVAYYEALEFYSNLSYSNYNPYNFQLDKSEEDLYRMYIKKWNQYIDKNVNFNISSKCKKEDKIISGFIITNKKKIYGDNTTMHICPSSNECSSGINIENDRSFEFGWILCSYENINEIKQIKKVVNGKGEVTCPPQMKIGFGFSITTQKSISSNISIEPCKSNKKSCKSKNVDENSQSFLWINCFPNSKKKLIETLESKSYTKKIYLNDTTIISLKCSKGKFIIAGFAVDYISSSVPDYLICPIGSSVCDLKIRVKEINNQEIHVPIIYIICSSL